MLLDEDVVEAFPEYKIVTPAIGRGSFKAAFLANDGSSNFVLKVLYGEATDPGDEVILDERFIREIQIMSSLNSPRIVRMHTPVDKRKIGSSELVWYGEPHYEGGSLDGILQNRELSNNEIFSLATHLLEGLVALESASIVHRDIKPANICQTANGDFVILDLGIAQALTMDPLTATGVISPMTNMYAAPEQFYPRGSSSVDTRTDLFAAGIVLFEAVSGKHPFYDSPQMTFDNYFNRLINHEPGQLKEFGCERVLQDVIDRCLAERQNRRFRTAKQALKYLNDSEKS